MVVVLDMVVLPAMLDMVLHLDMVAHLVTLDMADMALHPDMVAHLRTLATLVTLVLTLSPAAPSPNSDPRLDPATAATINSAGPRS
jgi:hypothetical protein